MTSPWASRAARGSAVVVAAGAAALSFRATADVAEQSGAVTPGWGWVVPLVVEAGVLTSAALAWIRTGEGTQARTELIVMGALLALSVVVNVSHADGTVLGKVLAAVPPVVLLVAVEGLLREQRRTAMKSSEPPAVPVSSEDRPGLGHEASWKTDAALAWPAIAWNNGQTTTQGDGTNVDRGSAAAFIATPNADPTDTAETLQTAQDLTSAVDPTAESTTGLDAWELEARLDDHEEPEQQRDGAESTLEADLSKASEAVLAPGSPEIPAWPAQIRPLSFVPMNGPVTDQDLAIRIRQEVGRGMTVTGQTLAEWLDVSIRTGQRRLKKLTDTDPQLLRQQA